MKPELKLRSLTWRLHWYRQSELEGALLLGRMVRLSSDHQLCLRLTRHCADEARHSLLWAETIAELQLPPVRIDRSYQSLYAEEGSAPANLLEVLAFTQVFERRVHKQFSGELRQADTPEPARRAFQQMLEDEKDHLDWVFCWLNEQPESRAALDRYGQIDLKVFQKVQPYVDRLWEFPGLGRELIPWSQPAEEELCRG